MISARAYRNFGAIHEDRIVATPGRLPVAGKIRPGIKVLTKTAAAVPGAMAKYEEGVRVGASFDDIAKEIAKLPKAPGMPLVPRNAPYFSVRQCDFSIPGAAATILDRYGEQREGDTEPKLYSFPVIFPVDDIDLVFREQFEAWRSKELLRWSEYGAVDGKRILNCMRYQDVAPDKSARKRWGGRDIEIDRACNPNDCDLFASGTCRHAGSLYFWVPGVKGVGTIELTFTSIYASLGIFEILQTVKAGIGRISGMFHGEPIFWISKTHDRVSRMDWEKGKPEKVAQWIIRLEASGLDMAKVLAGNAEQPMLEGPQAVPQLPEITPEQDPEPEPLEPDPQAVSNQAEKPEPAPEPEPKPKSPSSKPTATRGRLSNEAKAARKDLDELREKLALKPMFISGLFEQRYGSVDATRNAEQVRAVVKDLDALEAQRARLDWPTEDLHAWITQTQGGLVSIYSPELFEQLMHALAEIPTPGSKPMENPSDSPPIEGDSTLDGVPPEQSETALTEEDEEVPF